MFSTTGRSAIRAIIYIAQQSIENKKVGLSEIAQEVIVPQPYLGKVLQDITKHKLMSSSKGRGGGFFFQASQLDVSMYDFINYIDRPQWFENCALGLSQCSDEFPCPMHHQLVPLRKKVINFLKETSLRDMAELTTSKQYVLGL